MILLRRLRVHALKQLRDVDIWFPRRGSIVIEGQNEAGKSTLFEALYFALYGAALVGEDRRATLDDLIPHDASSASVELILAVGETSQTTLEIRRGLSLPVAGRRTTQQARLIVRRPGAPTEELNGPSAVNERILQELSGLDGDALRNSCFMEQKALDRVEALSRDQREAAVAKLLGLERLSRIERELEKACKEHAQQVDQARRVAHVAELRATAAASALDVAQAEARLRAAHVLRLLAERDRAGRETGGVWSEESRATALARQAALRSRLERDQAIAALLERIERHGATLAELRAIQDQLLRDRAELDGLAQVAAEAQTQTARLDDLRAAEALGRDIAAERGVLQRARELVVAQDDVSRALSALADSRRSAQVAASAGARETLSRWIKLKEVETLVQDSDAQIAALSAQHDADVADRRTVQTTASRLLALAALMGMLALAVVAAGFAWHPLWVLALVFAPASALLAWRWMGMRTRLVEAERRLTHSAERLTEARATRETARRLAGGLDDRLRDEALLRDAGLEPPANVEEARSLLAKLAPDDAAAPHEGGAHAIQAAHAATQLAAQREAELTAAKARRHAAEQAYQHGAGPHGGPVTVASVAELHETVRRREAELSQHCAVLGLPQPGDGQDAAQEWQRLVAVARGEAEATLRQLRERLARQEPLAIQIAEQSAALERRSAAVADTLAVLRGEAKLLALDLEHAPLEREVPDSLIAAYERLRTAVLAERDRLDASAAQVELASLEATLAERERAQGEQQVASEAAKAHTAAQVRESLREQGIACQGDEPAATLYALWPLLSEVDVAATPRYEAELLHLRNEAHHQRESASEYARTLGIAADDALDVDACHAELAGAEVALRHHELALKLAAEVRARIVRRVLPETEIYMRRLLPALTAGRYRDARLLAEEGNGADLRIALWDELAGRHVAKNLFSGGTRDQCSLALRLAFALATLPKELGALPGFIFLDEPLSSFDAERSLALVDVLTQGEIARQFAQVVLISHSQSIERASFRYHLRMAAGRVVASDLPDEHAEQALWHAQPERRELPLA